MVNGLSGKGFLCPNFMDVSQCVSYFLTELISKSN